MQFMKQENGFFFCLGDKNIALIPVMTFIQLQRYFTLNFFPGILVSY